MARRVYKVSLNEEDSKKLEEFLKAKELSSLSEMVRKLIKAPARPFPPEQKRIKEYGKLRDLRLKRHNTLRNLLDLMCWLNICPPCSFILGEGYEIDIRICDIT
jgi:hypothetical protein